MVTLPVDDGDGDPAGFRFNVLGPLEAWYDQRPVRLTGVGRSVLAVLTASPGRVVSLAGIVAGLWGAEPPDGAERAVASYVSRLRRMLGATSDDIDPTAVVVSRPPGYVLAVAPSSVDAVVFEARLEQARRAAAAGQPGLAADRYRQALALWRGEAYAEFTDHPFAHRQRTRLEELRVGAVQARIDAVLAAGLPTGDLVADLEALVAEHPHRERMWVQLMTALYREGRQADALDAYRRARTGLVEQLGVEPGVALREAERAVLVGDPALAPPRPAATDVPAELAMAVDACVGRDRELSWLTAQLDAAAFTGGRACVVVGPAGIGKTRLMAELADRAAQRAVTVRYGRGARGVDALTSGPALHLVVLDDVERLDREDSIRVESWLRATDGRPVLTVLTCGVDPPPAPFAGLPRLALTPLSNDHVAAVVRTYSPDASESAVSQIAAHAGGVPAEVHHAARDWAAARAGRRVGQAVTTLGDRRRRLDTAREDVVAGVLEVGRLRARSDGYGGSGQQAVVCPYKGLARYEQSDTEFFHGRDRLVAELVARLVDAPLLAVVGASGSGKSSVVRAGLLAALAAGVLPGSGAWPQVVLTPATAPASLPVPVDGRTVVVVDQFEEAFTVLTDTARSQFLGWIARSLDSGFASVVLTVRSDYYARCAEHPLLGGLVAANTVLVPRMGADELRQAIERPATQAGLRVEDGLVDLLVDQARDAPGALPLLSVALVSLWERRSGRTLTVGGYRDSGGVAGSVERLGEQAFAALRDAEQRDAARRMLLRLAGPGDGQTVTARRVERGELAALGGPAAPEVLDMLVNRRLVSLADDTVEVAHEALFTHWSRLQGWLAEDATGRTLRAHLAPAARSWTERDRDPAELYRGARLAAVLDWATSHRNELLPVEREFLEASRIAADAEARRRRRAIRRLRVLTAGLASVTALAVTAASFAAVQRNNAKQAALAADVRALGAHAAVEQRWDMALLYAAQAQRMKPSADSQMALLSTLQRSPEAVGYLRADSRIQQVALNGDGTRLVTGDNQGEAIIWDTGTHRRLATFNVFPNWPLHSMDVSDDGRWLAAVTYTVPSPGLTGDEAKLSVTDLDAARPGPRQLPIDSVVAVAFTTDPHLMVVRRQDGRLQLVDTTTGAVRKELAGPSVHGECGSPYLNMSPGRRYLTTGCGQTADAWDLAADRPIWEGPASDGPSAVDPTATTVIRAWQNGTVDKVDLATGRVTTAVQGHQSLVSSVTWSPDGRLFATTSDDATVMLWDPRTLRPTATLRGHTGRVTSARISPDGTRLYSAGLDSSAFIWDLDGRDRVARPVPLAIRGAGLTGEPFYSRRTNRAGTVLVSLYPTTGVLEVDDLTPQDGPGSYVLEGPDFRDADVDIDDAGQTAAIIHQDESGAMTVRVLDLTARRFRPFTINLPPAPVLSDLTVAISADGRTITTVDPSQSLRQWNASDGAPEPWATYRTAGPVASAQRSPDGHTLAIAGTNAVELVDLVRQRRLATIPVPNGGGLYSPAFSPDGRLVAVGAWTGDIVVADTRTGLVKRRWQAAPFPVKHLTFTPDGRFILSGAHGKAAIWSIDTPSTTNAVLDLAHGSQDVSVVVLRDGIVTIYPGGPSLLWDINADNLLAHACAIAGRNLTQDEWSQILPNRPYQRTCEQQA